MTMRQRANVTLTVLFVVFVLSLFLAHRWGAETWFLALQATVEAALVGSIADWFAVKALFDKPLGIPWHTRLVPKNRGRLMRAITEAVEEQILSKKILRSKLSETLFVPKLIEAVESYGRTKVWDKLWTAAMKQTGGMEGRVIEAAEGIEPHRVLRGVLTSLPADALAERLLALGIRQADSPMLRARIKGYLDEMAAKHTQSGIASFFFAMAQASNTVNTDEAADAAVCAIKRHLTAAHADKEHPIRVWLGGQLTDSFERLVTDEEMRREIDRMYTSVLANERFRAWCGSAAAEALRRGEAEGRAAFAARMEELWARLLADTMMQTELEAKMRLALYRLMETRGHLIGDAVERTLSRYGDDEIRDLIESKVGDDLQWIRLNGAIVGGSVGLVLFLVLHLHG